MDVQVNYRQMQDADYASVSAIFQAGIDGGNATYELQPPSWEQWNQDHFFVGRWIAEDEITGAVVGWVALSWVSNRHVFRGVAELSVYILPEYQGKGIGKNLMKLAIEEASKTGIWTIQSGIFPENHASIALHEKLGFRLVGYREKIGMMPKSGIWRDIILMELRIPN